MNATTRTSFLIWLPSRITSKAFHIRPTEHQLPGKRDTTGRAAPSLTATLPPGALQQQSCTRYSQGCLHTFSTVAMPIFSAAGRALANPTPLGAHSTLTETPGSVIDPALSLQRGMRLEAA
jgi:hypothetical protein